MTGKDSSGQEHPRILVERWLALSTDQEIAHRALVRAQSRCAELRTNLETTEKELSKLVGRNVQRKAFRFDNRVVLVKWAGDSANADINVLKLE